MHMFLKFFLDFVFNVLLETCYFKPNYALTKISFVSKHMISFTPKKYNLEAYKTMVVGGDLLVFSSWSKLQLLGGYAHGALHL